MNDPSEKRLNLDLQNNCQNKELRFLNISLLTLGDFEQLR